MATRTFWSEETVRQNDTAVRQHAWFEGTEKAAAFLEGWRGTGRRTDDRLDRVRSSRALQAVP